MIDNNWQGIAYLMLEVAGLDFIEAIQVLSHRSKCIGIKKTVSVVKSRPKQLQSYGKSQ